MSNTGDFQGMSPDQIKSIKTYRHALEASVDFVRPYFENGVRYYRLWAGDTPPEIETTFSQVMLWFAYAIVDQELTFAMRSMMTQADWLNLVAQEVKYERTAQMATNWLKYQMEEKQKFQTRGIAPIQSCYIFGNGYRWYHYAQNERTKYVQEPNVGMMGMLDPAKPFNTVEKTEKYGCIAGSNLNYFNAFPSPGGCEINTPEELSDERLDYFIAQFYPNKKWIEGLKDTPGVDNDQIARLFKHRKHGSDEENDPSVEYKQAILGDNGTWNSFSAPDWVKSMGSETDNDNLNPRYRCGIMFDPMNKNWKIVAEDQFLLYDGPPLLNCTPVANFKCSQTQQNFFSTGVIQPVEDLIISMTMNFNMRLDHLLTKFHPTKYIPQELVDAVGGDLSRFDTKPFNMIPYPHRQFKQGLGGLIHNESGEELSQQAFLEQGQMKEYLEDIISQKNTSGLANSTATVGTALVTQDVARSMLRAITVDTTGIRDCAEITLRMGAKYMNDDELVRTGQGGQPWELIEHDAIVDGYGVSISGARSLAMQEEIFKKQLSIAPMLLNDPQIAGQMEMKRQLVQAGGFDNVDQIMSGDSGAPQSPAEALMAQPKPEGGGMPGGVPSFQNDASSMNQNGEGVGVSAGGAAGI